MINGSTTNISGVLAAVLTPLNADLSPDLDRLLRHCRWLIDNGCDGLAVLGTTGEANSFSVDERIAILDGLAEAGIPGDRLLPGTGCCALTDSVSLTRRAVELGAAGVLMLPPFYYKDVSDAGLFATFAEIIERVGDSRLRIYLYHFPRMSAVPFSHALIEDLLKRYPDTVAGMKDSSGDLANMAGAARAFPRLRGVQRCRRSVLSPAEGRGRGVHYRMLQHRQRPARPDLRRVEGVQRRGAARPGDGRARGLRRLSPGTGVEGDPCAAHR